MKPLKKAALATVALLAATVLVPGFIPAAQAEASDIRAGSCNAPNFCLFENANFNQGGVNHWRDITHEDHDFMGNHWRDNNGYLTDVDMNDETSSVKNRTGCSVRLYENANYQGDFTGFDNGAGDGSLSDNRIGNDRASSALFFNCA
ncbi:peptidase inhibitor family I36 protein [Streptomyces jumonjinensis]|uniref:peptidase inhibitor family I36 protein n=1 Tax=Streptomyces jumonjinensis TaxID=1945 RepID=UPI0037876CA6